MSVQRPAAEALPGHRLPSGPYRVCLVCLGNICRSPMAEVVLREELARAGLAGAVTVESAGTGDWHVGERMYGPAGAELARRGYDGSAHRARQIEPSWLGSYDLLLAMDAGNLADLRRMARGSDAAGRVRLLRSFDPSLAGDDPFGGEVPDPYGGQPGEYARAFELIHAAAKGLAQRLAEFLGAQPAGR
jgi:protein-tyrosine phosphatase